MHDPRSQPVYVKYARLNRLRLTLLGVGFFGLMGCIALALLTGVGFFVLGGLLLYLATVVVWFVIWRCPQCRRFIGAGPMLLFFAIGTDPKQCHTCSASYSYPKYDQNKVRRYGDTS